MSDGVPFPATALGDRLSSGESVEAILLSLLDPVVQRTLSRCSVLRSFNAPCYEAVLRQSEGPPLSELLSSGQIETLPDGETYRVSTLSSAAYATFWTTEGRAPIVAAPAPRALRVLAGQCADWLAEHGQPLDRLDALVQSDVEAAGHLLEELFADSDEGHDLAGCHDLLDVLDKLDRIPLYVGTSLALTVASCRARLATNTLWAADYSASARYFPRPELERCLDDLLSRRHAPVLQLFARGGMGKTMQLRWFLARRCASRQAQIPCARIDFDHESAARASRNPWLLALRIAEQLEIQLAGNNFRAILDSHGSLVRLLYAEGSGASVEPLLPDDVDGRDVVGRITAVLAERSMDVPVVVVIDTCEELLRPGIEPSELFTMLGELVQHAPALRLVLAGRYDLASHESLAARGCDIGSLFPSLQTSLVEPFDEADRRRYLVEMRLLPEGEIVDAIVSRTESSPFNLATFADLARLDPDITADEIRAAEGPGLLYCIERILNRVEADVQWLLSYGVVPRRLSFAFLRDVMARFLVEGMRETVSEGTASGHGGLSLPIAQPPENEADLVALWQRMLAYASRYSWVWTDADGDLRFHPDVLEPLRVVARRASFYEPLHREAVTYFENLASSDQGRWADWTAEALYHRFQLKGPDAVTHWQDALTRARGQANAAATMIIASEPLRREYLDEEGDPLPFAPGITIVSWEMVAAAHVHTAWAIAEREGGGIAQLAGPLRSRTAAPHWTEVQVHLRTASAIASTQEIELPQPETDLLEIRWALGTGQLSRAAKFFLNSDPLKGRAREPVVDLTRRLVSHLQGDAEAWSGYDQSSAQSASVASPGIGLQVALSQAGAAADHGKFTTALRYLQQADALDVVDNGDRRVPLYAEALIAAGAPAAARAALRDRRDLRSLVVLARAELAGERPREALAVADQALQALNSGAEGVLQGTLCRLRGAANTEVLRVDTALADLHLARATARNLHDPDEEVAAAAQMCLLQLRQIGDLRNAAACLDDALDAAVSPASTGWLATHLARAEWQVRSDNEDAARGTLAAARCEVATITPAIVQLSVGELIAGEGNITDVVRRLTDHLESVEPLAARLMLLRDLAEVRSTVLADTVQLDRLRASVGTALAQSDVQDLPVLALRQAEVERVTGHPEAARRLLFKHVMPAAETNLFLWWRLVEGLGRCGKAERDDPELPQDPLVGYGGVPGLRAAWLIRVVQWRGRIESDAWRRERLDLAESLLQRPKTLPTRWRAHLDETRAEMDIDAGSDEDARSAAATASATWARLGQPRRRAEIASTYELGTVPPAVVDGDAELRFWLDVDQPERAHVHAELTVAHNAPTRTNVADARVLLGDVDPANLSDPGARLRRASALIAADWARWAEEVGDWIGSGGVGAEMEHAPGHLRLVCEYDEVSGLPWEMLAPPQLGNLPLPHALSPRLVYRCVETAQRKEHEVTAAQTALARLGFFAGRPDGLVGRKTTAAIMAFQEQSGLPAGGELTASTWEELRRQLAEAAAGRPLRVLVLTPSAGPGDNSGSVFAGVELGALYASRGAQVQTRRLGELLRSRDRFGFDVHELPDIVHVQATIDLVGHTIVVDTGAAPSRASLTGYGLDQLSTTALGDFLATMSQGSFGPAVIIETPWRPSRSEAVRSLLLRNVMGHALLGLGRTEAVLCTGGASPTAQHELREAVVDALAARNDLAQVAAMLQTGSSPTGHLEEAVSRLASAVFVQRSVQTLFPVGVS